MATDKNVQIRDMQGNNLFPKTLAKVVFNEAGANLGGVEAGAQVNKIEKIQLNGTDLAINNKVVNVVLPAAAEYTVTKQATAEEGYSATYQLFKDSVAVGDKINIPKDMVVSAGEVKTCTVKDQPVAGLNVGDPYIDLTIANAEQSHLYIPCKTFVDVYTAGDATLTLEGHAFKVNLEELKKTFQVCLTEAQQAAVDSGITAEKVTAYDAHVGNADIHVTAEQKTTWSAKQDALTATQLAAVNSGIDKDAKDGYDAHLANGDIHVTAAQKLAWSGKQDALDATQMAAVNSGITAEKLATALAKQDALNTNQLAAVNSGITAELVAKYDGYEATINGKADQATTLAGYGITDGIVFVELTD